MGERQYDVAVIGSGPAGYVAAIRASQLGLKTICIEKEATWGGTCLNVGCIPSKALLQSTQYYDLLLRDGTEHGIIAEGVAADFSAMQKRKDGIVQGLVSGVSGLLKKNKIEQCVGLARFISPYELEVTGRDSKTVRIEADHFIIATGSEPIALPFLPFDEEKILSSTGALALQKSPKKMLVVGAGVIGVELASVYSRLGAEVVIVEMLDGICPTMDRAISKALLQILTKQGLIFHFNAKVVSSEKVESGVALRVAIDGKEQALSADVVLVAIGRKPSTTGLGLEKVGIAVTPKGFIPVNGSLQTIHPHIYAIGDVVEGTMLAHRASEEGVAAAELIAGESPHINYLAIPNVIYTSPEVASIGLTENEAKEAGLSYLVGISHFKGNARARCHGETDGFVKVLAEASSLRLLGMHIIGPNASELIGEGVFAFLNKNTLLEIANASHAHPTLAEAIKEACLAALSRPIHG